MQVYANSGRLSLKTILLFILVLFIAFLPISSFLFFLKNDAFTGYFPPKFFMSESLHAGYLPLWNPYINYGIPQYGDMSSGFWSPVTWFIAATVGYNAYTFTLEVLSYLLIGGIGMYLLTGLWQMDKNVRFIAGIAFMCCGYNVGHLQHFNWISGAAFLPWCLWSYLLLLADFSLRSTIRTALLFYMLIASAHPGIVISTAYFFMAVCIFYFLTNKDKSFKNLSSTHTILIAVILLLSAGLITGYIDILPHFVRGEKISLSTSLSDPTTVQSWISVLLPFVTVKNNTFFATDISMRNCYFSTTLLIFFILACVQQKNSWQKFLLVTGVLFTMLSLGHLFKTFAYKFVPFIGYVRLNGEFTIFALLCFIIVAAIELNKFILQKKNFEGSIVRIYSFLEIILFVSIVTGLYKNIHNKEGILYALQAIFSQQGFTAKLKAAIDAISFYDTFWIQGIIQLFFLWGIKWCLKFSDWNLLQKLTIANIVIACLINIPYTGVGKASVSTVQTVLHKSPQGFPVPVLQPIYTNDTLPTIEKELVGDWSMYNKQIGVVNEVPYPIVLKNADTYFNSNKDYLGENFIFFKPATATCLSCNISPGKVNFFVRANDSSQVVLQQNFYPHWYYIDSTVKTKVPVTAFGINFMSGYVVKGDNNITFSFEPTLLKWMMLVSGISFLVGFLSMFVLKTK